MVGKDGGTAWRRHIIHIITYVVLHNDLHRTERCPVVPFRIRCKNIFPYVRGQLMTHWQIAALKVVCIFRDQMRHQHIQESTNFSYFVRKY
jgi:hypothetical protein